MFPELYCSSRGGRGILSLVRSIKGQEEDMKILQQISLFHSALKRKIFPIPHMIKITHHSTQESSLEEFQGSMSHHCVWGCEGGKRNPSKFF